MVFRKVGGEGGRMVELLEDRVGWWVLILAYIFVVLSRRLLKHSTFTICFSVKKINQYMGFKSLR